MSEPQEH